MPQQNPVLDTTSSSPFPGTKPDGLRALLSSAAIVPLNGTGWIRVTGEDRVRWLNGMVTNAVVALLPGQGCYNFILNAQGRIQGDAYAFGGENDLLLETDLEQVAPMMTLLDRFIIMDDVELADISAERAGILIAGPDATKTLKGIGIDLPSAESPSLKMLPWRSAEITVVHAYSPLVPRIEIWSDRVTSAQLWAELLQAGIPEAGQETFEQLRLIEGTPRFSADIRNRGLPQETGQARALHFAKGCYLGQEIVERIRSRGSVHRTLRSFRLEGSPPQSDKMSLTSGGKQVGELTSWGTVPPVTGDGSATQVALGYIRREAVDRNSDGATPIEYESGVAIPISSPAVDLATRS